MHDLCRLPRGLRRSRLGRWLVWVSGQYGFESLLYLPDGRLRAVAPWPVFCSVFPSSTNRILIDELDIFPDPRAPTSFSRSLDSQRTTGQSHLRAYPGTRCGKPNHRRGPFR